MAPVNDDVRRIARRIPGVSDRSLLELVNGLGVARGVTADRATQGVIGRLFADLTGKSQQAQLLTFRALIDGQQALLELSTESAARSAVTDLALARVATHLRHTKDLAAATQRGHQQLAAEFAQFAAAVGQYIQVCDTRIEQLETWRATVDLRLAAEDILADTAARALSSYNGIPWPYLTVLMARDLASGPCGRWETQHGGAVFRTRIIDTIVTTLKEIAGTPDGGFAVAVVLDESWQALRSDDHRMLLAELLDAGLRPGLALTDRPLTGAVALTMELAALPAGIRPDHPARTALELSRRRNGWVDAGATVTGFVKRAVGEQLDLAAESWRRWESGGGR